MRYVLLIIFLICLIPRIRNNPEMHNNPQPSICIILDLRSILRLTSHCHIHLQTIIDPMKTLSIPSRFVLISTYEIKRREDLSAILIKTSNKLFNGFPPMSPMDSTLTSHIWMMAASNMLPHNTEKVPIHSGLSKIRIRVVV